MRNKKEYIWSLMGRFVPQAIYLLTTMVLARFLSPEDFGIIGVLTIFLVVANTLMDTGLGGSLIKEKNITRLDCSTIAAFNVAMSLSLYAILFVIADDIESHYETPGLASVSKVLCLIFVINSFGLVPRALLMRDLKFGTLTAIGIISVILSAIVSILMALMNYGVWSLVAYQLVGALSSLFMSIVAAKYKLSFMFSWNSFKRLFSFGILTTLITIIDTIYENIIINIFGKNFGIQQAGYLSQAKKIEEAPSATLSATISGVSFPVLTKLRGDKIKFGEECNLIFKSVQAPLLPLLAYISLFSNPIINIVFGEQWIEAAPYLSLLIFAGIFRMAETLNRTFIKASTIVDRLLVYTLIKRTIGIFLIIVCLLINKETVLWGYVLSSFIGFVANAKLLSKILNISFTSQITQYFILLTPTIIIYILLYLFNSHVNTLMLQMVVAILVLLLYYFLILPLFGLDIVKVINQQIKKFLKKNEI